jgi:hypothetical protein
MPRGKEGTNHMSDTAVFAEQDTFVEAELNYLAPMSERPRSYTFEPPPAPREPTS